MDQMETIQTNSTALTFDDILMKSGRKGKNKPKSSQKLPKLGKKGTNDLNLAKKESKMLKEIEKELEEPERQNMIHIIQKYQSSERFGTFVRNELKITYTSESLGKKTTAQLQAILDKIRLHLDNKNLNKIYDGALYSTLGIVESISKPMGVNVDGFHTMLMQNEEFANCWERFKCESVMPTIPSHVQLFFILGQTYMLAYAINKSKDYKEPPEITELIAEVDAKIEKDEEAKKAEEKKKDDVIIKPNIEIGMSL